MAPGGGDYCQHLNCSKRPEALSAHRSVTYRFDASKRISTLLLNNKGAAMLIAMPHVMICNDIDAIHAAISDGIGILTVNP